MKIIPCVFHKTDAMILSADGTVFAFFVAVSPFSIHCFDSSFVSGVKCWTHISTIVINQRKNVALLQRHKLKHSIETSSGRCFPLLWANVASISCTTFLCPKFQPIFKMSTVSVSSLTFSRWSSNIILWIFFTISGVVTSFGRPLQCLSWQIVRPRLNSVPNI